MNTSPKRDIEGVKTIISFMAMKALENTLEKGQKSGDATKVITSSQLEVANSQIPTIEANVENHIVSLEGYRELPNGQKASVKINKKDREMQLARIKEQKENNKDSYEDSREI